MPTWTRAELETAFQHYQDEVEKACATRNWDLFAALFTEDATYVEHAYGTFAGREAIRAWITDTMTANFPGTEMPHFPIDWYVVDEERGRIVCAVFNQPATASGTVPATSRSSPTPATAGGRARRTSTTR
jgi:uncharacterized protein (TIGR02246 family)